MKEEITKLNKNTVIFSREKRLNKLRRDSLELQNALRARAKITSHFGISSSGHFWQILKSKNLEIVHYYCVF
jgi:hypothetical protein